MVIAEKGLGFDSNTDPKQVLATPAPSKAKGQKSVSGQDIYFTRFITPWARPDAVSANIWRKFVLTQPIAMDCKETLAASILGFDWSVTSKDSNMRDELKGLAKHYTKLIADGGNYSDIGYEGFIEWILNDFLDLPFGAAAEVGRKQDHKKGRVMWVKPLDGATLYPTLNQDIPVVQYFNGKLAQFPHYAISRVYMTPRTEILREGYGMAPPEKIYLAMEMLARGDRYYADLLLDTPPAGLLDLGDMEKDSALEWVKAFREHQQGVPSSFAIPVLYEHTTDVKFIPFGKVPNDLMYDKITLKYAAIVAAAYGLSLSDIGLQTTSASGETLAGSIRQERKTRRTGIARGKKAIKKFMEGFLPEVLQFNIIDPDDEVNLAMGKSRLSYFTAMKMAREIGVFSEEEIRAQALKDGLMSQDFPENIPDGLEPILGNEANERSSLLGSNESAASGGQGNIRLSTVSINKTKTFESHVEKFVKNAADTIGKNLITAKSELSEDDLYLVRSAVDASLFGEEDFIDIATSLDALWKGKGWLKFKYDKDLPKELEEAAKEFIPSEKLHDVDWDKIASEFKGDLVKGTKGFLGKSITFLLKEALLVENGVDSESEINYDNIVQDVHKAFYTRFDEYVKAHIETEAKNLLEKVRIEVMKNEETG